MNRRIRSVLLGSAWLALTLFTAGCGEHSPKEAYEEIVRQAQGGDWGAVYDAYCLASRSALDAMYEEQLRQLARSPDGPEKLADAKRRWPTGRDYFVAAIPADPETRQMFDGAKVLEASTNGNEATLTVKLPKLDGGSITEVFMLREGGCWKLKMP